MSRPLPRRGSPLTRFKGPKVPCPVCKDLDSRVLPVAVNQPPDAYVRRRRCDACGTIYESREIPDRVITHGDKSHAA